MLVDAHNVEAALAALNAPLISTRRCVSIQPEDTVYRFVQEAVKIDVNGWEFHPIPYAKFSPIRSGDGKAADTTTITFDGSNIVSRTEDSVDSVLQTILTFPLRDRPICLGMMVLDPGTTDVIGIIPQFVGFVDNTPFLRDKSTDANGDVEVDARLEFKLASFRAFAARQFARTYSDTDHQTRFPGDKSMRWISDAVFRGGKYTWNKDSATGAGAGGGGGGGSSIYTRIDRR